MPAPRPSLTRGQRMEVLSVLKRTGGLPVRPLSTRMGMSYMGVKQYCLELEKKGFLETWRQPRGVGGTLGALLTGVFATLEVNSNLPTNLKDVVGKSLVGEQLKAMFVTVVLSVVATAIIAVVLKATIGLRVDEEIESNGLDISEHGEEGYHPA